MRLHFKHILNPVFLFSLAILLLNDHVLKEQFPGRLTGKLSDLSGIIVFVQFLCFLTTSSIRKYVFIFSVVAFAFWKSEWSSPLIDLWNFHVSFLNVSRVIDYTDLFCLCALVPLYFYNPTQLKRNRLADIARYPLLVVTLVAVLATSRAAYFNGNSVYVNEFVKLRMNRAEFLSQMTKDNIVCRQDSVFVFGQDTFDRLILNNIILGKDTVHAATVGVNQKKKRIEVYVEYVTVSENKDANMFRDYREFKRWSAKYRASAVAYFDVLDE